MRKLSSFLLILLLPIVSLAQFAINGDASKLSDSVYQLTPATSGSVGSIWDSTRIDITKNFDISFNLRFGCKNDGAEGIAFLLQRNTGALNVLASNDDGMGYQNEISNSLAIEFDTDNDGTNDIRNDHVAIHQNGLQSSVLAAAVAIAPDNSNVEDCGFHRVRITYNATTNILAVFVDCQQRISTKIDIENDIFSGNDLVWMGFTASNGSASTPHTVEYIGQSRDLSFSFDLESICPDTLDLKLNLDRNEFKDVQWTVSQASTVLFNANTYKTKYKAPAIGTYKVEMSLLRVCDSLRLTRQTNIKAVDETDLELSVEIDTTCEDYTLKVRTSCQTCEQIQWDFDQQKGSWGFPNQILTFTRVSDTKAAFWAQAKNGSCFTQDSLQFDLKILKTWAPPISFSIDTLCAGDDLEITVDPNIGDSTGFNFKADFGLQPVGGTNLSQVVINPSGFGQLEIYRSVHYPKYSCVFNDTHFIQIDTLPSASFNLIDSSKNCNVVVYEFENTSQFSQSNKWVSSYSTSTGFDFKEKVVYPTKYELRLATRNGACRDTATWTTFPELYYPPVSSLSSDSTEGCSTFEVDFDWSSDPLDSVHVLFGNGTDTFITSNNTSFTKKYRTGTYSITYITHSGNGECLDTNVLTDYITVRDSVVARLNIADFGGCSPFRLDIEDSSYFGNAVIQNKFVSVTQGEIPRFRQVYFLNDEDTVISEEGTYNVIYYVSNGYCSDTIGAEIVVKGLTKKDTVDLYGVTIDGVGNAAFTWKAEPVAEYYDVKRVDDAGSQRIFQEIFDTTLVDFSINSNRAQYNYTVTAIDDCGGRSAESYISSTILLKGEVSQGQIAELNWNSYERFPRGVRNYVVQEVNGAAINTNGNQYFDDEFFDENNPDTGKCYVVYAYENRGDSFISASNILCLEPVTQVYFPSAFTPNADPENNNEVFMWRGVGVKNANLRIFNRWGQRVFEGENNWDGTFNGGVTICEDGLYHYVATFTGSNGETYFYSGPFYLLR
ncbi:MAG: gliding motility-associated C-terminal domain-containing protein [Bacteroidia bacterium]